MLTKVACPHCKAVLRSNKPLPVGLQVKCVKCQKPFAVTADGSSADAQASSILVPAALASSENPPILMSESMAGTIRSPMAGSHAGVMKSPLAGSQAGTARSPMAGSHAGVSTSPMAAKAPPSAPLPVAAVPPATNGAPLVTLTRPPRRSRAGIILAVLGVLAVVSAGTVAVVMWCFREDDPAGQTVASTSKKIAPYEIAPPPPVPPVPETKPAVVKEPEKKPEVVAKPKRKPPTPAPPKPSQPEVVELPPPITPVSVKDLSGEQKKINDAIEKGVVWLKAHQMPSGSWIQGTGKHSIGHAALPALALLECQVPVGDPAVQKAAKFVRDHSISLADTYDLGLAVLFLDRLGDPRDRTLIQTLAMRIVAGQNAAGGWDYRCPILSVAESQQLLTYLQKNRPQIDFFNPIQGGPKLITPIEQPGGGKLSDPIEGKSDPQTAKGPADPNKSSPAAKPKIPTAKKDKAARPDFLPPNIRDLAVITNQSTKVKGRGALKPSGRDDNSNTQFALLGLWAARRHDVPTEFSFELTDLRFQQSQAGDGGWGYVLVRSPSKNSMTCVGLLGLAMGHGSAAEAMLAASAKGKVPPKASLEDQFIHQGLKALGEFIDLDGKKGFGTKVDLYFLWSLERVAVLYNLKTIGKKDWYGWGAKIILNGQKQDGYWRDHYEPPIDTSFALLFLKRSNLIKDLTENLNLYLAIKDPEDLPIPKNR